MIGFILILIGSMISLIGSLGLIRFPDIYTRTHAQTVINVGGTCLLLFGVFLDMPFPSLYSSKSLLLIVFIFLTSPVGTHAIARAAYKSGFKPRMLEEDELGFKVIEDERPFKKPEPKPEAKKASGYEKITKSGYRFKPMDKKGIKYKITKRLKKDEW
ncbi:MAG: monovalent cation/H(+) antiporter subunit G [Candidatus Aenigmatarchaeota archaeon]